MFKWELFNSPYGRGPKDPRAKRTPGPWGPRGPKAPRGPKHPRGPKDPRAQGPQNT